MANKYPNSHFVGVDMADVFPTTDIPPNVTFRTMNAGSTFDFEDASFDFVFQRFLVMGLPVDQYKRSVQEMKRVLKLGGAIEIMELVNDYKNAGPAFKLIASWRKYNDNLFSPRYHVYPSCFFNNLYLQLIKP